MSTYRALYGASRALVLGVDRYAGLPPLSTAVRGAQDLAVVLNRRYGFEMELLTDEAVSLPAVLDWFERQKAISAPDDRLLIAFAGHGLTRGAGPFEQGYLALHDTIVGQWHTALNLGTVLEAAERLVAKHVLIILDCCMGGLPLESQADPETSRSVAYYLTHPVRYLIVGGRAGTIDGSLAPGGHHSLFTHHLLTWLSDDSIRPPAGIWRAAELGRYLERAVARGRRGHVPPVHGCLSGQGDFLFHWEVLPYEALPGETAPRKAVRRARHGPDSALHSTSRQVRREAVIRLVEKVAEAELQQALSVRRQLAHLAHDPDTAIRQVAEEFLERGKITPRLMPRWLVAVLIGVSVLILFGLITLLLIR